jgi:hypothetical protein
MAKWCETCYREHYAGCDDTCPAFGKDFEELAAIAIKYEDLIRYLKDRAEAVRDNEDSVFADERGVAEYDTREIIDTLLNLEL